MPIQEYNYYEYPLQRYRIFSRVSPDEKNAVEVSIDNIRPNFEIFNSCSEFVIVFFYCFNNSNNSNNYQKIQLSERMVIVEKYDHVPSTKCTATLINLFLA